MNALGSLRRLLVLLKFLLKIDKASLHLLILSEQGIVGIFEDQIIPESNFFFEVDWGRAWFRVIHLEFAFFPVEFGEGQILLDVLEHALLLQMYVAVLGLLLRPVLLLR